MRMFTIWRFLSLGILLLMVSSYIIQHVSTMWARSSMKIYAWCIWEILERCTRKCKGDPKYGDCPLYGECKGRAHNCDGFYKIDDLVQKWYSMSAETFETEWLNKRPSQEVLVYGKDWKDELVIELEGRTPREIAEAKGPNLVVSGIDFGSSPGHPFVYSKYFACIGELRAALEALSSDFYDIEELKQGILGQALVTFYLFYEYRSSGATMRDHADKIRESPEYRENEIIFADPSAKQARIDLETLYGIPTYPADNAVEDGIDMLRLYLRQMDYGGESKSHFFIIKGD